MQKEEFRHFVISFAEEKEVEKKKKEELQQQQPQQPQQQQVQQQQPIDSSAIPQYVALYRNNTFHYSILREFSLTFATYEVEKKKGTTVPQEREEVCTNHPNLAIRTCEQRLIGLPRKHKMVQHTAHDSPSGRLKHWKAC